MRKEAVSILRIPEMPEIFGFLEIPAISEISDLHVWSVNHIIYTHAHK